MTFHLPFAPDTSAARSAVSPCDSTPRPDPATFGRHVPMPRYGGVLDQIGSGVLVLGTDSRLRYANPAALRAFGVAITLVNGYLKSANPAECNSLSRAIARAHHGLRTMLYLSTPASSLAIAILPLHSVPALDEESGVLLLLGREESADPLVLQLFARDHALTGAESRVLGMLCSAMRPSSIARELGVAVSTVRTQLQTIRAKTGTGSLLELVRRVAMLPSMTNAPGVGDRERLRLQVPDVDRAGVS